MKNELPLVTVWCDGSSYPSNPGTGGWAAILCYGERVRAIYGYVDWCTNNYAEAAAIYYALNILRKPCRVHVYSDSNYCVFGLGRVTKSVSRFNNDDILLKSNRDIWLAIRPLMRKHVVTISHVDGHSTYQYNELADSLAGWGSKDKQEGSFYVNDLETNSAEKCLLETVERRVEKRKERKQGRAAPVATAQRRASYR